MELLKNEVHIWLTPVAQVPLELIAQYKRFMSLEEQDRNQRFRFEHSRRSDCVTRALIRTTLSHYYDKPFTDWAFIKGEHGKPEIDQSPIPLRFNVSHTSSHVICAVTREWDIGIDIENIDRKNNILDIADRFFSSIEVKQLFSMPKERQLDRFFDYWTLKESYMKARGEGAGFSGRAQRLAKLFIARCSKELKKRKRFNMAVHDSPDRHAEVVFRQREVQ